MSAPLFYAEDLVAENGIQTLSEDSSRHIVQVLRKRTGDAITLTNGKGLLAEAVIEEPHKLHTTVCIHKTTINPQPAKTIIAISPVKNTSRFEWFLEKSAELGVREIVPLICERTEREKFRRDRMHGILISAMLQSRQTYLTHLHEPMEFSEYLCRTDFTQKLIAHCESEEKKDLHQLKPSAGVSVLIGPEGDFSVNEITDALKAGYDAISLGSTRLRTETAGLVAAVWMQSTQIL
jgi:16S rRNA (uracil1498-N3)-methyltransferase